MHPAASQASDELLAHIEQASSSPSTTRALIVHPERASADTLEKALNGLDIDTRVIRDVGDAPRWYSALRPDLLVLDLDSDGTRALGLIRQIHAVERHKAKLLVLSDQLPSQLAKVRRAGAHAILTKPIDPDSVRRSARILLHSGALG